MNIRAGPIFVAEREWKDVHAVAAKVNHIIQISCYSYSEPPFCHILQNYLEGNVVELTDRRRDRQKVLCVSQLPL